MDVIELKEVSRAWRMEAMNIDDVATVNEAHEGKKTWSKNECASHRPW